MLNIIQKLSVRILLLVGAVAKATVLSDPSTIQQCHYSSVQESNSAGDQEER